MKLTNHIVTLCAVLFMTLGFQNATAADNLDLLEDLDKEVSTEQKDTGKNDTLDLFSELEGESAEKKEEDKLKYLTMLGQNIKGSLRLRGHAFFREPEDREGIDERNPVGEALLKFETWTGGNTLRLDLAGWLEGGSQQDTYDGISRWPQDKDRQRHYLELNELYLSFFQDRYDITVGKKIFQNGISTLFSPADRYRPTDSNDPLDPKDFGMWQTRLDYYYDRYSFTAAIFPVFNTGKNPSAHSRWSGKTGDYDIYEEDTSGKEIQDDSPALSINSVGYFGRVKTTMKGWDLFLSVYHGLNPYYVQREEQQGTTTVIIKENVKVGNYAAGFSTAYKKWEFHGEALFNYSYDGKDDDYLSTVGGFTYTIDDLAKKIFLKKIDVTIEYANEIIVKEQYADGYTQSSRKGRLGHNNIFTRINFKYNEDLNFQYVSDFEFDPSGRYNKVQSEYKIRPGLVWTTGLEFFNGKEESHYGRWERNDRIITDITYSF